MQLMNIVHSSPKFDVNVLMDRIFRAGFEVKNGTFPFCVHDTLTAMKTTVKKVLLTASSSRKMFVVGASGQNPGVFPFTCTNQTWFHPLIVFVSQYFLHNK